MNGGDTVVPGRGECLIRPDLLRDITRTLEPSDTHVTQVGVEGGWGGRGGVEYIGFRGIWWRVPFIDM